MLIRLFIFLVLLAAVCYGVQIIFGIPMFDRLLDLVRDIWGWVWYHATGR